MISIPQSEIPRGIDYQWATKSICGDERSGDVPALEKTGWRKVPKDRHPTCGSPDPAWIVDGAMILMERPQYLTDRARLWEQNKADAQVLSVFQAGAKSAPLCVNGRPLNMKATTKRKTNPKEFVVKHGWRAKVAIRDWWAGRK